MGIIDEIKKDPDIIHRIEQTRELAMAAVEADPHVLSGVDPDLIDDEMAMLAVSGAGIALEFVPEDLRTEAVCRMAVRMAPSAFEFVPEEILTPEFCRWAYDEAYGGYDRGVIEDRMEECGLDLDILKEDEEDAWDRLESKLGGRHGA